MACDTSPSRIRIEDGRAIYECAHGRNDWSADRFHALARHIKRVHALDMSTAYKRRPTTTTIAGRPVFGFAERR